MTYTGWIRRLPRGHWRKVCEALSWCGCWDQLLTLHPYDRCEKVVLGPGRSHPRED